MKMYYRYLKYILEHKKNVFIECINLAKEYLNEKYDKKYNRKLAKQLIIHAFTHDLSKFSSKEFKPYAVKFFGNDVEYAYKHDYIEEQFNKAWEHHYKHNKHHPEYWAGKDMPFKYIRFMVCDLKAMSRKFGGTAQEYYLKNYYKWDITHDTRHGLEIVLDLIKEYNAPICECNEEYWSTIDELIAYDEKYRTIKGVTPAYSTTKEYLNDLLKPACDRYNIDIYELVKGSIENKYIFPNKHK